VFACAAESYEQSEEEKDTEPLSEEIAKKENSGIDEEHPSNQQIEHPDDGPGNPVQKKQDWQIKEVQYEKRTGEAKNRSRCIAKEGKQRVINAP